MSDGAEQRKQYELIQQLSEIVAELGWVIGMPNGDDMVEGLIIGEQEFVEAVVTEYYGPGYGLLEEGPEGEMVESEPKKKTTVH